MTVETAEQTLQNRRKTESRETPRFAEGASENHKPVPIEPDLDFIRALRSQGGTYLKKCIQCGTCSATCDVSSDAEPFPCREMAWANWGMKDRLLAAPGIWLCHQCNDCSVRCPRGAQPGEVISSVRRLAVQNYAVPRFLGRWVNRPHFAPLLLGIPAALLTAALVLKSPIESALGIAKYDTDYIIYSYSSLLPQWILNSFFGFFTAVAVLLALLACARFWRAMKAAAPRDRIASPAKALLPSVTSVVSRAFMHDEFTQCTKTRSRFVSHLLVLFGFTALALAVIWMVTARHNPLIPIDFKYPLAFLDPWKMLANVGGLTVVVGTLLMMRDRITNSKMIGVGSYFDWSLIVTVLIVAVTGFATELMHYLRLEPHRHVAYFAHLLVVAGLIMYLPYTKLSHMFYRITAMIFVERYGPEAPSPLPRAVVEHNRESEETDDAADTATEP